jgi:carbamoyltransferase
MIYWGVVSRGHDASLTVVEDREILFAGHAERFSGVKNDPDINQDLIDVAMKYGAPDQIVWYERPWLKASRHLWAGQSLPELQIRKHLATWGITAPLTTVGHHESHAAGGFYTSGFQDASILVCDAIGEWDCISIWQADQTGMKKIHSERYPNSLGLLYSAFTQRLGLKPNEEEYIMMGMAALGEPRHVKRILDDFVKQTESPKFHMRINVHRGILGWAPELNTTQDHYDIAASIQKITEDWLVSTTRWMRDNLPSSNLVLSGGVALNCKANTEIAYLSGYRGMWIMPNPGDAGSSMGAIAAHIKKPLIWKSPYLGTDIEGDLDYQAVVEHLVNGEVVGLAKGRAEWGPRSLGNRALLADPRGPHVKDLVNTIKNRQKFRPFAPMIMAEFANQYFEMPYGESPYMQFTATCRFPESFPAICHFDNTSRVQTVTMEQNPMIYRLLSQFYERTQCPMLLNTSLNIKGQPLVDTWQDAMDFQDKYGVKVF